MIRNRHAYNKSITDGYPAKRHAACKCGRAADSEHIRILNGYDARWHWQAQPDQTQDRFVCEQCREGDA